MAFGGMAAAFANSARLVVAGAARGGLCGIMAYRLVSPPGSAAMSQAIVDPAELRRFAGNLKRFNADLQAAVAGLHGQLMALGDSWRDQEHDRFRQEFEATMQVLERFLEISENHIPFLLRKAERIEEYLAQR